MPLHEVASVLPKVSIDIPAVVAIRATTNGIPGEVAGPALRVTVKVRNASAQAVETSSIFVGLTDAAHTAGIPITGNGSRPFASELGPGKVAVGIFAFTLPAGNRTPITVTVGYSKSRSILVFTGNVS